jgi:hypothetical protein
MFPWASLTRRHSRRPRLTTSAFTNFMPMRTRKRMALLISTKSDTHFRLSKHAGIFLQRPKKDHKSFCILGALSCTLGVLLGLSWM